MIMEYGCIGAHLPHSFSKEIHARIGDYSYVLKELTAQALPGFFEQHDFCGINVTIPYKEAVIPYLDAIDPSAAEVGAVNTIVNRNGKLFGYNTDVAGMERLIENNGLSLENKKVLILGTGGTSKTAVGVAKRAGAASVYKVSRSGKEGAVTYEEAYSVHTDAQVLINTTPCGMFPAPYDCPAELARFPRLEGVLDAVYNPLSTRLVLAARERGIPAAGGLYMLVAQAVAAYEIFFQTAAPDGLTDRIYSALFTEKQNVVLIGMPGSGKSTVGRLVAADTGREFLDTDAMIEASAGMPIAKIFETKGEAYFRDLETAMLREAAKRSGVVIATGGGAVLRKENLEALRMNGKLCFLNVPPAQLVPTDDRPLANTAEAIDRRYRERYPIYLAAADETVSRRSNARETALEIERRHGYETACDQRS